MLHSCHLLKLKIVLCHSFSSCSLFLLLTELAFGPKTLNVLMDKLLAVIWMGRINSTVMKIMK